MRGDVMKGHISAALNTKLFLYTVGGIVVTTMIIHYAFPSASTGASSGAPSIVRMALRIESHLSGPFLNQYDMQDPGFQDVIGYLEQLCGGTICVNAQPPLQCAMYVATVFAMEGHPLPQTYNAVDYWAGYKNRQGWQETPVGSGLPLPGDMMVWAGGTPAPGYPDGYGHIAIVVAVQPPNGNANGSVTVAQANGTYTLTTPDVRVPTILWSGVHLYQMPILPNLTVQTWPGFSALGYIRDSSLVQSSSSGYSVVGPPTISAHFINSVLAANHSPAAGTGQELYDLGVQYGIDPVFALAFFQHESDFGTQGEATVTMSLGN